MFQFLDGAIKRIDIHWKDVFTASFNSLMVRLKV